MNEMKAGKSVYLDVCALERPYDDADIIRNEIEAAAVYLIVSLVVLGEYTLWHSPVHDLEIGRNQNTLVASSLSSLLENLGNDIRPLVDAQAVERRAHEFVGRGIRNLDALHLAHAEHVGAAFISCDDGLLNKCARENLTIWCGDPLAFCRSEGRL